MKSIYILDDHPIITEGIAQLLANNQQYQITTGHHDSELYNYLNDHTPDLLIIDYEIQDKTALDVITYLQKKGMNIPQLIYTMHTEFWIIKLLIKAEVAGIVTKNDKIEEIEKAIHNILHEGNKYYSPTALNVVLSIMATILRKNPLFTHQARVKTKSFRCCHVDLLPMRLPKNLISAKILLIR